MTIIIKNWFLVLSFITAAAFALLPTVEKEGNELTKYWIKANASRSIASIKGKDPHAIAHLPLAALTKSLKKTAQKNNAGLNSLSFGQYNNNNIELAGRLKDFGHYKLSLRPLPLRYSNKKEVQLKILDLQINGNKKINLSQKNKVINDILKSMELSKYTSSVKIEDKVLKLTLNKTAIPFLKGANDSLWVFKTIKYRGTPKPFLIIAFGDELPSRQWREKWDLN